MGDDQDQEQLDQLDYEEPDVGEEGEEVHRATLSRVALFVRCRDNTWLGRTPKWRKSGPR